MASSSVKMEIMSTCVCAAKSISQIADVILDLPFYQKCSLTEGLL